MFGSKTTEIVPKQQFFLKHLKKFTLPRPVIKSKISMWTKWSTMVPSITMPFTVLRLYVWMMFVECCISLFLKSLTNSMDLSLQLFCTQEQYSVPFYCGCNSFS